MDRQLERGSSPGQGKAISPEAQLARLRAIRKLVEENNQSCLSTEMIVCQIYMESRFDKTAQAEGSSARGLIQLLKVANGFVAQIRLDQRSTRRSGSLSG